MLIFAYCCAMLVCELTFFYFKIVFSYDAHVDILLNHLLTFRILNFEFSQAENVYDNETSYKLIIFDMRKSVAFVYSM